VLIQDMTREMNLSLLQSSRFGRLGCVQGLQAYITPFTFAHYDDYLYSFATVGRKIEWMRANPLVCVEVENLTSREEWQTIVIFGRYQELPATTEFYELRVLAHDLLAAIPNWWEPGFAKTVRDEAPRSLQPVYFRISIGEMTGHQGISRV
jgi:nitroimidazol reductase NimA-like FMN-containing flavoprotein (pyridoxamine 5'-phosphate oxidase superfamily)